MTALGRLTVASEGTVQGFMLVGGALSYTVAKQRLSGLRIADFLGSHSLFPPCHKGADGQLPGQHGEQHG